MRAGAWISDFSIRRAFVCSPPRAGARSRKIIPKHRGSAGLCCARAAMLWAFVVSGRALSPNRVRYLTDYTRAEVLCAICAWASVFCRFSLDYQISARAYFYRLFRVVNYWLCSGTFGRGMTGSCVV